MPNVSRQSRFLRVKIASFPSTSSGVFFSSGGGGGGGYRPVSEERRVAIFVFAGIFIAATGITINSAAKKLGDYCI